MGQERLVGSGDDVILENVEDQLINDPELDFVVVHDPYVIRGQAVETNDGLVDGLSKRTIELHVVSPIEPLVETLAVFGGDCRPMREQIDAHSHVHVHDFFAAERVVGVLSKRPSPLIGTDMRGPQQ